MERDLQLTSEQYSLAVSIFFVGYLALQVPSNMILSRSKPRLYLPALMVSGLGHIQVLGLTEQCTWGCLVIGYVGVTNEKGLIALRFVLGIVEAGENLCWFRWTSGLTIL